MPHDLLSSHNTEPKTPTLISEIPSPTRSCTIHRHEQITRVCGNSDRRLLFRGWNRLCVHAAASLSTFAKGRGDALTVATAATGSEDIEKGEKSARRKVEHGSSLPGVSDAAKDQMGEVDSREAVHGKRIVEEARTRDIGDMERRWRYGCQLVRYSSGLWLVHADFDVFVFDSQLRDATACASELFWFRKNYTAGGSVRALNAKP